MRRGHAPPHAEMHLLLFRSLDGTCSCACAAIDAFVGIDHIFAVLLGNCADRTSVCAGPASDALFGVNDIRHNDSPFLDSIFLKSDVYVAAVKHIT